MKYSERYKLLKSNGICVRCGKNKKMDNHHVLCEVCAAYIKVKSRERLIAIHADSEKYAEYLKDTHVRNKKRRERLLTAGLCLSCGAKEPREGKTMCQQCADKDAWYKRKRIFALAKNKTKEVADAGSKKARNSGSVVPRY